MLSQQKLAQAHDVIAAHNSKVPEAHRIPVEDAEALAAKLYSYGAATDEDLQEMTWEAWMKAVGVPERVAQAMSRVYRGAPATSNTPQQPMIVMTHSDVVSELTNHDLAARYAASPNQLFNAVAEQLRARSRNKKCIAWNTDGTVDVETTATVLAGIASGDDYGDMFVKEGGEPTYLFRVGECVGDIRDEHPLYPGKPLLKDGRDHHGVGWREVPFECRQLLRLARSETRELDRAEDRQALIGIRDVAKMGMTSLSERYPRAFRLYNERKALGGNPPLKVRAGSHAQEAIPA